MRSTSRSPDDDAIPVDATDWETLRRQLLEICEVEALRARAARLAARADAETIVCTCAQVTRGRLAELIAAGLDREDIGRVSGAGTNCGGCTSRIDALIDGSSLRPAILVGRERLDRLHTQFTLQVTGADQAPPAGAHVLVEATIDGRALARSYTLTGWDLARKTLDIIVRYEPNGLFSRWLHDFANHDSTLRVSRPLGHVTAHQDERFYLFAAGIGITPALTRLKALATGGGAAVWLHWSGRFAPGSRLTEDVLELVAGQAAATAVLRDTAREGRLSSEDIAMLRPYDGGRVHVCGPVTYMDDISDALAAAGWPRDRIVRESFVLAVHAPLRRSTALSFDARTGPIVAESFHLRPVVSMRDEAIAFLRQFYIEHGSLVPYETRLAVIEHDIETTGTYDQTYEELAYGARLAWRNATRCVGRFFWQMLSVRDMRHVATEAAVFEAIVDHIRWATNAGDLRPAITVFRPGGPEIRIINPQLILYAGYRQPDGTIRGDPKNVDFTDFVTALGWSGRGTRFDVLPVVIRIGARPPRLFTLPPDCVLEIALSHPEKPLLADLGLKWFAVPAVADMALDLGGLHYTAAPSSGIYMGTEIGSFNLGDPRRYDMLPAVADALGFEVSDDNPLWRDQALLEINRAVLHSFRRAGTRIFDHHALSKYFMRFMAAEKTENRPVYGHWPWIVPPMSSNLSDIWHEKGLKNVIVKPNYMYQPRGAYLERHESSIAHASLPTWSGAGAPANAMP